MGRGSMLLLLVGALALGGAAQAAEREPPIAGQGAEAVFLRAAHARVHPGWVGVFLANAGERLPPGHPLNDRSRSVVVAVTLILDGTVADVRIDQSSGSREFDEAALDVVQASTMFPQPPDEVLSDDGRAHLRWTFARDARGCSGVRVVQKESPLDIALPRLLVQGRDREVMRRVRAAAASPATFESSITTFALAWLERQIDQSVHAVPAAIALAGAGDPRGAEVLRTALEHQVRVEEVTVALARLRLPAGAVPPAPPADRRPTEVLARILRKGELNVRVEAATALLGRSDPASRRELATLARDPDPALQLLGAAALDARGRAAVIEAVGIDGRTAYRALARNGARRVAGEWLLANFDRLSSPVQVGVLGDWLWGSREPAPPVTLSAR